MLVLFIVHLLLMSVPIKAVRIPFINNTILRPIFSSSETLIRNLSCDQCLCYSNLSHSALNCLSNDRCQLFPVFPDAYRIAVTPGARLYFPRKVFPNASQCSSLNTDDLLSRMMLAHPTWANISDPSELLIDNHGYIVTVDHSLSTLSRFNTTDLRRIDDTPVQTTSLMAVSYNNGAYFIKGYTTPMVVMDSTNRTTLNNMTLTSVNRARSILFLNDGQTMIVTSYETDSLVFFNRSNTAPVNYTYVRSQLVSYSGPYGMWRVNDSFFYVTSYDNYSLYSYSSHVNGSWTETFAFKIANLSLSDGPMHVTIDEKYRFWIALGANTTLIYDQQGHMLGDYTIPKSKIVDVKILAKYVIYFSDIESDRIIRIDPDIPCI